MTNEKNSIIVPLAYKLLKFFRFFTISFWIGADKWSSPRQVELWVLCNLFLSVISYLILLSNSFVDPTAYTNSIIFIAFAFTRIIDILTYQMKLMLIPLVKLKGYRRTLILTGVNYLEIIFWFASVYLILVHLGLLTVSGPKAISVLRESIGLMVSSDSGLLGMNQRDVFPWIAVTLHSFVGLFMTTVVAARIIAILPRPGTADSEERIRFRSSKWRKKMEIQRAKRVELERQRQQATPGC